MLPSKFLEPARLVNALDTYAGYMLLVLLLFGELIGALTRKLPGRPADEAAFEYDRDPIDDGVESIAKA